MSDRGDCTEREPSTDTTLIADFSSQGLDNLPVCLLDSSQYSQLRELFLDYNNLECLPGDLFQSVVSLRVLSLAGNNIKELPSTLGELKHLEEVYLQENELSSIPVNVGHLNCLRIINLVGNQLSQLPHTFGQLIGLERVFADENNIKCLPNSFGHLENLQVLEIPDNQLTTLPQTFGQLHKLSTLNLSGNKIEHCLPESFSELRNLVNLDLSGNKLKQLPAVCKSQHKLKKVYVESNILECLPDWISDLPEIEELSVKDNQLKAEPFTEVFGHNNSKLKNFDISGNFISALPESLGHLQHLEKIHIGSVIHELERRNFQNGNWIWQLPSTFPMLVMLKEARLDENQIRELPEDFGCLVNLEFLDLGQNQLHCLPASFPLLRSLKVCQLSKNHLKTLPHDIGDLASIEDLRLDNNQIEELPDSMSRLSTLHTLDVFNNCLHELPKCLESLTNLKRLDLDQNDLSIDWYQVPKIRTKASYAPRDPALADNWRGRARQDLINLEITQLTSSEKEGEEEEEEEEDASKKYSYWVLKKAAWKNMSLWQSHSAKNSTREVFRMNSDPQERDRETGLIQEEENGCDEDEDWECDLTKEQQATESIFHDDSAVPVPSAQPIREDAAPWFVECTEDWEAECEPVPLQDPYCNGMYTIYKSQRPDYGIPADHLFVPGDFHVGSLQRPTKAGLCPQTLGQFDDVD